MKDKAKVTYLPKPKCNEIEIEQFINHLFEDLNHEIIEIRAIGNQSHDRYEFRMTAVGYYTCPKKLKQDLIKNNGNRALYFGLNPRPIQLLHSQKPNILINRAEGCKDKDIQTRNTILIDLDPKREIKKTASNQEEYEAALKIRDQISNFLKSKEVNHSLGISGNGGHILVYTTDYSHKEKVNSKTDKIALFLRYLDRMFSTEIVEVDNSTFSPGQICKFYGTTSIKGANTSERPWRNSSYEIPEKVEKVDILKVFETEIDEQHEIENKKSTKKATRANSKASNKIKYNGISLNEIKLDEFIRKLDNKNLYPEKISENKYTIHCPWSEDHSTGTDGDSSTCLFTDEVNNTVGFKCLHSSHTNKTTIDLLNFLGIQKNKTSKKKKLGYTFEDFEDFFNRHLPLAKRNIFNGQLMIPKGKEWIPAHNQIGILTSYAIDEGLPKTDISAHLDRFESEKELEFLIDIPEWDKEDRISALIRNIKVTNVDVEVMIDLIKDWGAKAFRRVKFPSIQNRMIIFKGPQGIGKDELIKAMFKALGQLFSECIISSKSKDTYLSQSELFIIHISEFDKTLSEPNAFLKALITQETAFVRKPYAKLPTLLVNRSSFISSVNIDNILRDPTGARRFLVFEIESIDWEYPRDQSLQILAQFKELAESGYKSSKNSENQMKDYLTKCTPQDPKENFVELWNDIVCKCRVEKIRSKHIIQEIKDLSLLLDMKPKDILSLVKQYGGSKRDSEGMLYGKIE